MSKDNDQQMQSLFQKLREYEAKFQQLDQENKRLKGEKLTYLDQIQAKDAQVYKWKQEILQNNEQMKKFLS